MARNGGMAQFTPPRPLKISYVLPVYWPALGGCELHTHELVKRLSERHVVHVVTLINNQEDKVRQELWFSCILQAKARPQTYLDHRATVTRLPLNPLEKCQAFPLVRVQSPKVPFVVRERAMQSLVAFYRRRLEGALGHCDLIHGVHGGVSYWELAAYHVARKRDIPFVYTPLVHLSQPGWREEMDACRRAGHPFVYNPQLHLQVRGWTDPYWYQLCFAADAVITMTELEREFFVKRGMPANKLVKVGVGPLVSEGSDVDPQPKPPTRDHRVVLFLGRNHECKGIEELLTAAPLVWEKAPDTRFLFVGPLEGRACELFSRHRDPRIVITGAVSEEQKSAQLESCDLLCVPSLEESLGGVYLEAWFYKKPIIAADIPPLRELSEDGKGGFLVVPEPTVIAEKILCLLDNPRLREEMGRWGRRKVLTEYNWQMLSQKTEALYSKLVESDGDSSGGRSASGPV
jgi:glycosyltransferase involved in cell wall biosynthesis